MRTQAELSALQALPLEVKIEKTRQRIREWVDRYGVEGVYVSFSGGKDSTVLVDIIDKMGGYTDIPLVYVDTGLEYPEIREFVKGYGDRVTWLRPHKNFKQVIQDHGYPFISKEVSKIVNGGREFYRAAVEKYGTEDWEELAKKFDGMPCKSIKNLYTFAQFTGYLTLDNKIKVGAPKEEYSNFSNKSRWRFLVESDFKISNACCQVMKKSPAARYTNETGRHGMTAMMAAESKLRTVQWKTNGCNGFDMKKPISNPMAFWTEQDVLLYIKKFGVEICSVYGEVVRVMDDDTLDGQLCIEDLDISFGLFDLGNWPLKTSGCERTGCMFCGYGCTQEKGEGRFVMMKRTHPKQYDYIMRPWEEGGLNYKEVIDWINEHGGTDIKY